MGSKYQKGAMQASHPPSAPLPPLRGSSIMSCKSVLDTSFLRLFQVDTNHLCQHREETWVIIRQRGTSEGKVLRCGKSAGLNIQIVENLQLIKDKSIRTYTHPLD